MEVDRGRRNGVVSNRFLSERFVGGAAFHADDDGSWSPPRHSHSASPPGTSSIEHRVSRLDTLAGIAIKYGVEVADIKRMNGLVTDLQMFAHKKIYIPLPGRHPPSPVMSNDSASNGDHTPTRRRQTELLDSFQSLRLNSPQKKVSPAMSLLQGYYGLATQNSPADCGTEMSVYGNGTAAGPLRTSSPSSELPPNGRRKSRSYANGFLSDHQDHLCEDGVEAERGYSDKSVRRRQKTETDYSPSTPELLMKEENGGIFSAISGKGLVPRPKSGTRIDSDSARLIAVSPVTPLVSSNGSISVRKSSSTSNLQESETSLWPATKWVLKADSITRPIFDGLPIPMTSRRNKAALD